MTTSSPHIGLVLPTQADRFSTADIKSNWEKLDAAPGNHICTSVTRPSWGTSQAGRKIFETNTRLTWTWTGTTWVRDTGGTGVLRFAGGTPAVDERATNFSTASTSFVKVQSLVGVVVPAGTRPLQIVAKWFGADNALGPFDAAIFRSNTNNSGPQLSKQRIPGAPSERGGGGTEVAWMLDGIAAGTYDFSLQIRSDAVIGGTSWIYADAAQPIRMHAIEL